MLSRWARGPLTLEWGTGFILELGGEMRIGELARGAGVNVETIRFYERRGLIPRPPRRESGYRVYGEEHLRRLHFIRRAKDLGFSLEEVRELLALRAAPGVSCARIKQQAGEKLADIEGKLETLERMRDVLARLVKECRGRGPLEDCPILAALEGPGGRRLKEKGRRAGDTDPPERRGKMSAKRTIEVFSAGCPVCQETVAEVRRAACPSCEVTVLDMKDPAVADRARALGVRSVPAVAIDGKLAGCCAGRGVDIETLKKEGLGRP
jgi:MerR family copper efflux transcriptional regulator